MSRFFSKKDIKEERKKKNLWTRIKDVALMDVEVMVRGLDTTSIEQLEYAVGEYVTWYTKERPHESLGGQMIDPWPQDTEGEVVCFQRLGGLLKSYRRVKRAA